MNRPTFKAWYRGAWGNMPRQLVTITGIGQEKGRLVLFCVTMEGRSHWGYMHQFDAVERSDFDTMECSDVLN